MDFRRWNFSCTFYYNYYLIMNLPALLSNVTPLVSRFFAEMSKKRQRCAVVDLKTTFRFRRSLQTVTAVVTQNKW
jgi:hypothetical protein